MRKSLLDRELRSRTGVKIVSEILKRTRGHAGQSTMNNHADSASRRAFLLTGSCMGGGLIAGYGTLGIMAGQFLYPADDGDFGWQFVASLHEIAVGESREYVAPSGARVVVARQTEQETADAFIALSSVCPHLGCRVHWEPHNSRFFCPCHNGAFDRQGQPTEGPPAAAGQQLVRFPLKVEDGLLFIEAPLSSIARES